MNTRQHADRRADARTWPSYLRDGAVCVAFACLTLLITYPLPAQMTTHLAGDDYDVWARPWATWWTKTALSQGRSLYHTDLLYYPRGTSLVYHSFSHVNTAIALALEPVVGPIAAHNVTVLLAYVLSGFGMVLLAQYITGSGEVGHPAGGKKPGFPEKTRLLAITENIGPSFLAGLVFTFSTYHVDQSSHLIILTTQWIPLWILFVLRLIHEPRHFRHTLPATLFLTLTALSSWHLFLFSLLWLVLYLVYLAIWERERLTPSTLGALTLMGALTLIAISPLLFPLLTGQLDASVQQETFVPYRGENAIDVLAFFVPSRRHPLFGPWVEPLHARIGRRQVFLGYTTLVLAILGVVKGGHRAPQHPRGMETSASETPAVPEEMQASHRRSQQAVASGGGRQAIFWALSTLVFFSMSLGPHIRFNGTLSERPLQPWLLPVVEFLRDTTRLTVMTTLGLAVLAALGVTSLVRRASYRARAPIILGLCALVMFEALPWPFPTTPINVPSFYEQVGQSSITQPFAIADIPVRQLELRRLSMFYQTIHHQPIVEGIVARTPSDAYDFIDRHPILSAFTGTEGTPGSDISQQLRALADAGVDLLVLHRRFLTAQQMEGWRSLLPYSPTYDDPQIVVYRTRPVLGQDLQVHVPINNAIGLTHTHIESRFLPPGEPISLHTAWVATQCPDRAYRVRWTLLDPQGNTVRTVEGEVSPEWPTETWQAGDFALDEVLLPSDLPPGPYRLHVQLVDERENTDERDVGSVLILPAEGESIAGAAPATVATFGDHTSLDRLQTIRGDRMLHLHLEWQALDHIDRDYKLFVHLLDREGELAGQVDTMPRDWTAPTSTWHIGDTIGDLVSLDTSGLPAGPYSLAVGLYDPASGDRLPVRLPGGSLAPDAALHQEIDLP